MKYIITIIVFMAIIFFGAKYAVSKQEVIDCNNFNKYAKEQRNFTVSPEENEMCFSRGIVLEAKVK